jgi:hypothetical protein
MPRPILDLVAAVGLAALLGSPASAAPYVFVPALASQVAPGTGGGTYASFGFVDVDPLGAVVFSAAVSGGNAPGGLFSVARPAALKSRAIALVGDAAPGASPATFAEFQGATILGSEVAFLATFDVQGQAGIYLADLDSGTLTLVAKVGGPSPTGAVFQQLGVPSNRCGDVVFAGAVGPSELLLTHGIFRSAGGTLSSVALEGDPAPGYDQGTTFQSFGDPNCEFTSPNRVGFSANVTLLALPPSSGVFRYAGATDELIAAQGDPSPDGVPYGPFSVESPGASFQRLAYTDGAGLFLSAGPGFPAPVLMARLGQTAPDTGGGTFAAFPRGPAAMSTDNGTLLVALAEVSGGSTPSGVFRMFRSYSGVLSVGPDAIVGGAAPGTGGGTYSGFSRPAAADASNPYIGESGVIAFAADVSGGTASSGVFVLPEPGGLPAGLAGVALLALLCAATECSSPRPPRS